MSDFSRIEHWLQHHDDELEYDPDGLKAHGAAQGVPHTPVIDHLGEDRESALYGPHSLPESFHGLVFGGEDAVYDMTSLDNASATQPCWVSSVGVTRHETPFFSLAEPDPSND